MNVLYRQINNLGQRGWRTGVVAVAGVVGLLLLLAPVLAPVQAIAQDSLALTDAERAWLAENPRVRVHNETNWPPFNFAENGQATGYSIDFMNLVAKKTGLEVDYVTGPTWGEFHEMMKRGELDVMLNIVKTPDRLKYLAYTRALRRQPQYHPQQARYAL